MLLSLQERFLRSKSEGTREVYARAFQLFADSGKSLSAKPMDALEFVDFLEQKGLSVTSINIYLRHMKAFFNWLVSMEVIPQSPFRSIKPLKGAKAGKELYEDAEIKALLSVSDLRWSLIITLAATSGLRESEILNLTIPEVDYETSTICIQPKQRTNSTWQWEIKDRESRTVPLSDTAVSLLARVQDLLSLGQPYLCISPRRYNLLKGRDLPYRVRKMPVNNFHRDFKSICQQAGVRYRTFHALRGTALTRMMESNALQLHEVSAIAGHAQSSTTLKSYLWPRREYLDKARTVLNLGDAGIEPATC